MMLVIDQQNYMPLNVLKKPIYEQQQWPLCSLKSLNKRTIHLNWDNVTTSNSEKRKHNTYPKKDILLYKVREGYTTQIQGIHTIQCNRSIEKAMGVKATLINGTTHKMYLNAFFFYTKEGLALSCIEAEKTSTESAILKRERERERERERDPAYLL